MVGCSRAHATGVQYTSYHVWKQLGQRRQRVPRFTNQRGIEFVKNDKYFGMRAAIGIPLALHRVRYYLSHRICARTICTKQQGVKFAKMINHLESKAYRAVP